VTAPSVTVLFIFLFHLQ